jgi:hypothetical protein
MMTDINDGWIHILEPPSNKVRIMLAAYSTDDLLLMGGHKKNSQIVLHPETVDDVLVPEKTAAILLNARDGGSINLGFRENAIGNFQPTVHLNGSGNLILGGSGQDGDLILLPSKATEFTDTSQASIILNGGNGNLYLGGSGTNGDLFILPSIANNKDTSQARISLNGNSGGRGGSMTLCDEGGEDTIVMTAHRGGDDTATARIGGGNRNGQIILRDDKNKNFLTLGAKNGDIVVRDKNANPVFGLYSKGTWSNNKEIAWFAVGKHKDEEPKDVGKAGVVLVRDRNGNDSVTLDGLWGNLLINDEDSKRTFSYLSNALVDGERVAGLWIGRDKNVSDWINKPGVIGLFNDNGDNSIFLDGSNKSRIVVRDKNANPVFGLYSKGTWSNNKEIAWFAVGKHKDEEPKEGRKAGVVLVRNPEGNDSITLDGVSGDIVVRDKNANPVFGLYSKGTWSNNKEIAWFAVGKHKDEEPKDVGKAGVVLVRNPEGNDSITLDGVSGDIVLANADCAEEFDISSESTGIEPGTVMVMDSHGRLKASSRAYDKRVAGVISGAGEYKPGIVLDKKPSLRNNNDNSRLPIALVGKVYCKVDAKYSQVSVGDLLTTSPTHGHAMKATNRSKAFGAVIGKALGATKSGKGLIPILIALQ